MKMGSLSVKFERNPGAPPKIRKNSRHHGTNFHHYSVAYGVMSVRLHTFIIGFRLTTPLSQAPLLGQDELTRRKRDLDTRGLTVRLHTLPVKHTLDCTPCNHEDIGLVNGFIGLGLDLD